MQRLRGEKVDDDQEHSTIRPPPGSMTKITIYRLNSGGWSFIESPHCLAVESDLADGYYVSVGKGGELFLFGAPGTVGLSANAAVRARLVQIPVFRKKSE
jgi:hypothetical protein